jgi:hypothetical protein
VFNLFFLAARLFFPRLWSFPLLWLGEFGVALHADNAVGLVALGGIAMGSEFMKRLSCGLPFDDMIQYIQ